jgi:membrane protease YdiL (CAAX protease family)
MMMNTHLNTKRIVIFLAIAFAIPWTATVVLRLTVGVDDLVTAGFLLNWIFTLWTPALANVATRLITKEGRGRLMLRPNLRRGWRFYLAAWVLPWLAVIVGTAVYYLLFPQFFDSNLGVMRQQLALLLPPLATWTAGANCWEILPAFTLLIMMIVVPIYGVISFGEEFGWRAYLLPKLVEHFAGASAEDPAQTSRRYAAAVWKAALLVGVIWGVWHWPARLLYSGMSIPQLLLDLVPMCSVSLLMAWVTLRSGSMWPAALGHSAYNQALALPILSVKGPANVLLGPAPSGLIGGIGYVALALVLLFSRRAFAGEKEARSEKEPAAVGAQ